jgi:hypothetical protein
MDSFNKVISFALGLVVVLVFFAVVTGKINLKSKTSTSASNSILTPTPVQKDNGGFFGLFKPKATPTPTQKPVSSITVNTSENNVYKQNTQSGSSSNAKSIPSTGLPTIFIPMLFSGLAGGSLLRKAGKK